MWRLSHARIAKRYLKHSHMTGGQTVDKLIHWNSDMLATRAEVELKARCVT